MISGCYYKYNQLIADDKLFKLSDNSVFSCSYTCQVQKGDYIFLNVSQRNWQVRRMEKKINHDLCMTGIKCCSMLSTHCEI